jgi:hypothetical protein
MIFKPLIKIFFLILFFNWMTTVERAKPTIGYRLVGDYYYSSSLTVVSVFKLSAVGVLLPGLGIGDYADVPYCFIQRVTMNFNLNEQFSSKTDEVESCLKACDINLFDENTLISMKNKDKGWMESLLDFNKLPSDEIQCPADKEAAEDFRLYFSRSDMLKNLYNNKYRKCSILFSNAAYGTTYVNPSYPANDLIGRIIATTTDQSCLNNCDVKTIPGFKIGQENFQNDFGCTGFRWLDKDRCKAPSHKPFCYYVERIPVDMYDKYPSDYPKHICNKDQPSVSLDNWFLYKFKSEHPSCKVENCKIWLNDNDNNNSPIYIPTKDEFLCPTPAPVGTSWTSANYTSGCRGRCYYSDGLSLEWQQCDDPVKTYKYRSGDTSCNQQSCLLNFTVEKNDFKCPKAVTAQFLWFDNKCFYSDGESANIQTANNSMSAYTYFSQDPSCNELACLMEIKIKEDPSCTTINCITRKNKNLPTSDNFPCKKANPVGFTWVNKDEYNCLKDSCYYSDGNSFNIMDCDNSLKYHKYVSNQPSCNPFTCMYNPNIPLSNDFNCPSVATKGFHWIKGESCQQPGCYYSNGNSFNILDCANNNQFFQYSSRDNSCNENNCNKVVINPTENNFFCFTVAPQGFYWVESPDKNICYFSDGNIGNFENFLETKVFYKFFSQDGSCNKDTCGPQNSYVPKQNQFACVNPNSQGGLWSPKNEKCDGGCYYSNGINFNIINCNNPTMGHGFFSNHSSCNEFSCNDQLRITNDNFFCLWPATKGFQWIESGPCGLGVCYYSDEKSLEINPCNGGYLRYQWSSKDKSCNRFTCTNDMPPASNNDFLCNPLAPMGFMWDDSCNVCFYSDGIQGNLFNCDNNKAYTFSSSSFTCNKDTCYGENTKNNNFLCGATGKTFWFDNQCFYIGDNPNQPYQGENNFYQWVSQDKSCDGTTCSKVLNVKSNDFVCVEKSASQLNLSLLMIGAIGFIFKFF